MKKIFTFLLLFFTTGCCTRHIVVRNDYLTRDRYASFHVATPDPRLICPELGQRLTIYWNVPDLIDCYSQLTFTLVVRFGNLEEETISFPLQKSSGNYQYSLVNDAYFCKGGILTYKVEIQGDERVLDTWKHQLWTELIVIQNHDET